MYKILKQFFEYVLFPGVNFETSGLVSLWRPHSRQLWGPGWIPFCFRMIMIMTLIWYTLFFLKLSFGLGFKNLDNQAKQDQRSQSWPQETQEIHKLPSLAQLSQNWNILTDIPKQWNHFELACKHPRNASQKFQKEISYRTGYISKKVTQLTD